MSTATAPAGDAAFWDTADRHVLRYAPSFSPVLVERAQGTTLTTSDGRELLDFTSGQMSAILGHSHPRVVAALREAAGTLDHLFSGMLSRPVVDLSRRIAATLPDPLDKVLLLSTGAEANEAALRLAKLVTGGWEVVSFDRSWHGMTLAAGGATYAAPRRGMGPGAPGNYALPTPDAYRPMITDATGELDWRRQLDLGWAMIDAQSTGNLAACIVEPVLSVAGVVVPPPGYLEALQEHCHRRGMLLILDEAQTGLGRTGDWYAFERDGIVPDVVSLSKTLGAGTPLSAIVTTPELEARAHERGYLFFTTHVSDPLPASVGLAVLDVLEEEGLVEAAREHGAQFGRWLAELADRHDVIGDVRGRGLMQGVELVLDREAKTPSADLGDAVTRRCLELGLHMNIVQLPGMGATFRIAPPLTATAEELHRGVEILDTAIGEVAPRFA